jgi:hypothetical protein
MAGATVAVKIAVAGVAFSVATVTTDDAGAVAAGAVAASAVAAGAVAVGNTAAGVGEPPATLATIVWPHPGSARNASKNNQIAMRNLSAYILVL